MDSRTVGILGGGQLGRMMVEAANRMNIKTVILDAENAPAKQINAQHPHVNGSFQDPESIRQLARQSDIITAEIEHVNVDVLQEIEEHGVEVVRDGVSSIHKPEIQPDWRTIQIIQDKYAQKEHLQNYQIPTAESIPLDSNSAEELSTVIGKLGLPCMLKSRTQAYDGRGNYPIKATGDIPMALQALGKRGLYVERWAPFLSELAVMVAKIDQQALGDSGDYQSMTLAYPVVETVHQNSICKLVYAPAQNLSTELNRQAESLARRAVATFPGRGVLGVEMFLLENGELLPQLSFEQN